jgi:hypothetical protein
VNPNATAANVTWRLYDKTNALVGSPYVMPMPPYAVVSPSGLTGYASGGAAGADLSDAWLSYTSDQPIVAYGSVIDNGTQDPTYIPASEDTGVAVTTPSGKVFVVTERGGSSSSSAIDIAPAIPDGSLKPGDTVTLQISARDSSHGFRLMDPNGTMVLDLVLSPGGPVTERTITLSVEGTYSYYCTVSTCSPGHLNMQGTFVVGKASPAPPGY